MHRRGIGLMLCCEWWRSWEQQLLEWHGTRQWAREVLCSNQPEGLPTMWWRCMLCSECCVSKGRRPPLSSEQRVAGVMAGAAVQWKMPGKQE